MSRFFATSGAVDPGSGAFEILAAPNGAWPTWAHAFYNATTATSLFGLINSSGSARVGEYPPATSVEVGVLVGDQHNAPAVIKRSSDGKYVAAMCHHAGSEMYINISTNANDNDPWAGTDNIDPDLGGEGYTYPWLAQLGDETGDPIYLGFRVQDGAGNNWCLSKSTDGGVTWDTLTNITFGERYYGRFVKSSEARIDFAVTDGSYASDNASLYHAYYEAGDWHTTDGSVIAGSPPFDITDFTLVYDGSSDGARIPNSIAMLGTDIAITFPTMTGSAFGGVIGTDGDYKYARWDGAAWTVTDVATAVGMTAVDFTEGGLAIDPADLNHLAASIRESGTWRMHDCVSADDGATWTNTQITSTGAEDRYPWFVIGHPDGLYIWQKGTFTSQTDFDVGVWGYTA